MVYYYECGFCCVHYVCSFLACLFRVVFVTRIIHPLKKTRLKLAQIIGHPSVIFKGEHISSPLIAFTKVNNVDIAIDVVGVFEAPIHDCVY